MPGGRDLNETVRLSTRQSLRFAVPFLLLLLPGTNACTANFTTDLRQAFKLDNAAPQDEAPPPIPEHLRPESAPLTTKTRADQVNSQDPDGSVNIQKMGVAQVGETDSVAAGYMQPVLGSDDPCVTEQNNIERCGPKARPAPSNTCRRCTTAQEMTILAPTRTEGQNFDPAVAVQEIGRGRTVSQASQSVGNAFLTGPETPTESSADVAPTPLQSLDTILPGTPWPDGGQ